LICINTAKHNKDIVSVHLSIKANSCWTHRLFLIHRKLGEPLVMRRFPSFLAIGLLLATFVLLIGWRFSQDIKTATARAAKGSLLISTRCGPIEYQEAGAGVPLLMVHGSGGGHDQGMAFAGALAQRGMRVIAMSRFGYLRTPMPADASAAAQADAHVCLLDALGINKAAVMGGSAGAPSALQMAIDHADRVSALVLLVPLAYKPPSLANSAAPLPAWVENTMMRMLGSDFLFWAALHVARDQVIKIVLATPPELLATASLQERARVDTTLENILPVSARAQGLRSDTLVGKRLKPSPLELVRAPTLIISTRDDGYGTYANAQYTAKQIAGAKFIGFETGGHLWIGHNDEVQSEIVKLLMPQAKPRG
jgi:2-hydroxy-6-oxonona-2,4-dienedioate hydrolase